MTKQIRNLFTKFGMVVGAIALGTIVYGNAISKYENKENLTYQGYRYDEGQTILVFDPKPITERENSPEFSAEGNLKKLELESGENYDLFVKSNWFNTRIVDATPSKE